MYVETGLNRKIYYAGSHRRQVIVVGTQAEGLARPLKNPTYPEWHDLIRPDVHVSYTERIRNSLHMTSRTSGRV